MFENIIGHRDITTQLSMEINQGRLPNTLLFHGPAYSGKLTTALELARVLTCEKKTADWNCTCRSCKMQRQLIHPYLLMLGSRYFINEITACSNVLLKTRTVPSQYLFIRSVRKLINRFNSVLWEGNENKLNKINSSLNSIDKYLESIQPGNSLPDANNLEKIIIKLTEVCKKIVTIILNSDNIPIDQIRNISFWAQTTSSSNKIIIFENAERMLNSSRNALLKIIEEPPKGVYFILLTTRKGGIVPTVYSRVRPYQFYQRSDEVSSVVLKKIFRETSDEYKNIREYFLAWNINISRLRMEINSFIEELFNPEPEMEKLNLLFTELSEKKHFYPFLEELTNVCRKLLLNKDSRVSLDRLEAWNKLIQKCLYQNEHYNQSYSLLVESLFYRMKEMTV